MQVLCGLQVLFLLFNCQTPGKEQRYFTSNKVLALLVVLTVIPIVLGGALLFLGIFDMLMNGQGESVIIDIRIGRLWNFIR